MPIEQFANNAATTLSAAITTTGQLTCTVASATAFPAAPQFRIIIDSEILIVTAGAGTTTWTITRGAEGTTAATHSSGAIVTHVLTAASLLAASRDFDVRAYGAKGDATLLGGGTNDTAAFQAAMDACNAAGGGTVHCPGANYLVLSLHMRSNVRLLGEGAATLVKAGGSGATAIVDATGTLGTAVNLNANAAYRTTTVTAATNPAGLVAGDWVVIRDATYTHSPSGRNQETNRILSVSGAGPFTFTLASNTIGSYATASTAEILKLTPVTNAAVEGLTLHIPVGTSGGNFWGIYCTDFIIQECAFRNPFELAAVRFDTSSNVRIFNNDIRDGQSMGVSPDNGLGFHIVEASHNVIVAGNYIENVQESPATDNARYVTIESNQFRGCNLDAVNAHGGGVHHIIIRDNTVVGGNQYGIGVYSTLAEATDIEVSGNRVVGCKGTSIVVIGSATFSCRRIIVRDNHVSAQGNVGDGAMIEIAGLVKDFQVIGNQLDGTNATALALAAMYVSGAAAAADVTDGLIAENVFTNIVGNSALQVGLTTRVQVDGNQFHGGTWENFKSLGSNTSLRVINNIADSSTGVTSQAAGEFWRNNYWGATSGLDRNTGSAAIASGGTISHGLYAAPATYGLQAISATPSAIAVTAVSSTTMTVTFAGGGTQTFKWWAEV